ncbi:hypothetical protein ZHAS_00015674 [Anopheles sinensis]|uniref:Uncharacterized protein n=1 Tax=Anopheles sinensis TaxID=74873 RepID=A0A084WBN9_ANOSI|nr:hypothetical protein ZHAS_00015674 [Anopheles sinensis]
MRSIAGDDVSMSQAARFTAAAPQMLKLPKNVGAGRASRVPAATKRAVFQCRGPYRANQSEQLRAECPCCDRAAPGPTRHPAAALDRRLLPLRWTVHQNRMRRYGAVPEKQ